MTLPGWTRRDVTAAVGRSPFASDVCSQPIFNSMGLAVSDMNPTSPGRSWKAGAFSLLPPETRKPVIAVILPHIYALWVGLGELSSPRRGPVWPAACVRARAPGHTSL